jgi:hypothetical protein
MSGVKLWGKEEFFSVDLVWTCSKEYNILEYINYYTFQTIRCNKILKANLGGNTLSNYKKQVNLIQYFPGKKVCLMVYKIGYIKMQAFDTY